MLLDISYNVTEFLIVQVYARILKGSCAASTQLWPQLHMKLQTCMLTLIK